MDVDVLSSSAKASAASAGIKSAHEVFIDNYFTYKAGGTSQDSTSKIRDGMVSELLRLATFAKWPRWAVGMPNRLARHGFFYTGQEDEVQCFCCKVKIRVWNEGDLPDVRHRSANLNCPLLKGAFNDVQNVSLPRPAALNTPALNNPLKSALSAGAIAVADSIEQNEAAASSPTTPTSAASIADNLKYEHFRRQTFHNWPTNAYVGPDEMAQAGFMYMGTGDRVQCVFCKGILKNWVPGDRAFKEHQSKFPNCPFVKNPRIGAPQPISEYRSDDASPVFSPPSQSGNNNGGERRRSMALNNTLESLEELGVETDLPKKHSMALLTTRITTFKHWPKADYLKPRILAEAGFYFIDRGDSVKCFWCDGGLRNWEEGDDPWLEHARYFPKCGHLKRTVGSEFVEYVKFNKCAPPGHSATTARQLDPREVTARMDTSKVRSVLDMGFDKKFVEKVIHYRLATDGDDFADSEHLLDTLLRYQDNPPQNFPLPSPSAPPATSPTNASSTSGVAAPASSASKSKKKKKKKKKNATGISSPTSSSSSSTAVDTTASSSGAAGEAAMDSGAESEGGDTGTPMDTSSASPSSSREEDAARKMECRICMENDVDVLFLPCRHLVSCHQCAPPLNTCPLCRAVIKGTVNVYMP